MDTQLEREQQVRNFPDWFKQTSLGRKLITENEKLETQQRQKIIDEIAEIRAAAMKELPGLRQAAEDARQAAIEAERQFEAARDRRMKADSDVLDCSMRADNRIALLETRLRNQVAAEISGYRERIRELRELTSKSLETSQRFTGKYNALSLTKEFHTTTNAPSVRARLAALVALDRALDTVIALIADGEERQRKFEAMLAEVPELAEPTEWLFSRPARGSA